MRVRGLLVVVVGMAAVAGGCGDDPALPPVVTEAPLTVVAERGDVVPTVVLDGVVVAGTEFPLLAPAAGSIVAFRGDGVEFRREDGPVETLPFPRGARALRPLVDAGVPVPSGYPLVLLRYDGFVMRASVSAAALYRLRGSVEEVLASVHEGPGPFPCPPLGPIPAFEQVQDEGPLAEQSGSWLIQCAVPEDVPVLAGLPGKVAVRLEGARDVVVLPLEAVAGRADRGRVLVREGNKWVEREVRLGPHDGVRVAVLDGLREGEIVRIPGPVFGEDP